VLLKNIFLSLLLLVAAPAAFAANDGSGPEVGNEVPLLNGYTLEGESYRLRSDKGSTKVINFFWVGCHPCREEMPELAKLEKQFKSVKFISVHTTLYEHTEEPENVAKFIKSLKAAPSNIVLTTSGELGNDFNIKGLPHTMILDENNNVLLNIAGYNKNNMQILAKALHRITKQ